MADIPFQKAPAAARPKKFRASLEERLGRGKLDRERREFLQRWSTSGRSNELWGKIQKKLRHGDLPAARIYFIDQVLAIYRIARSAENVRNQFFAYRKNAKRAEMLADFLDPKRDWLPPPVPSALKFVPELREVAQELRRLETRDIGLSRKDQEGSRERVLFMRQMTELVIDICGRPLDGVVAALTDFAFPGRRTTIYQVRSARRGRHTRSRRQTALAS
jgi:hypothetical protein